MSRKRAYRDDGIFNIFGHQGNTNQNHNELCFTASRMVITIKTEHKKQGNDVEKPKLCTLLLRMQNGAAAVEDSMGHSKKIKQNYHMILKFHFQVYIPEK